MKKWTRVGWMRKNDDRSPFFDIEQLRIALDVFNKKGTENDWGGNWPPKKVRVTVEEI